MTEWVNVGWVNVRWVNDGVGKCPGIVNEVTQKTATFTKIKILLSLNRKYLNLCN